MALFAPAISFGSDLLSSVANVAVLAGTLVLVLMLVGFGAFAYKSLRGDGITWPSDMDEEERPGNDGVREGGKDDEWKYY